MNILDKIFNLCTTNISRKLVDSILYMGQIRVQLELIDYLCKKDTDEALQIVLFDYYMYCYIYQYGKFEYDSWYYKYDSIYLKQICMRNKYGLEEALKVEHDFVEPKINNMFNRFCNSLIEKDVVIKSEFEKFLQTETFSIAPPSHRFEGLSRSTIISEQGSNGMERYLLRQYTNCESFKKFPNSAYYKFFFNNKL